MAFELEPPADLLSECNKTYMFQFPHLYAEDQWYEIKNVPNETFAASFVANELFWEGPRRPFATKRVVRIKNGKTITTYVVDVMVSLNVTATLVMGDTPGFPEPIQLNPNRPRIVR